MNYSQVHVEDDLKIPANYSFTRKTLQYVCREDYDVAMFFEEDELFPISSSPSYLACVTRLQEAINKNEKTVVYGDYDVDGITATTICYDLLLSLGVKAGYYIPNRMVDGYGLQVARVEQFHQLGYQLIICVDNGVVAHEAMKRAHDLQMDVIIIDHHEMDERSDSYPYLIHSSRLEPQFKGMCGAGLVFEFSRSFLLKEEYVMLAALGTVADMMLLVEENRRIVRRGIALLNSVGYLNLKKFAMDVLVINEFTLAMQIAPRLNTLGRLPDLANANQVVKYFLLKDEVKMDHYMAQVEELNVVRKSMAKDMLMYAQTLVDESSPFLILTSTNFHEGLVGLVANQLLYKYHKPVMVCQEKDGICKGSLRSVAGLDLVVMMRLCPHILKFGGHPAAGGITFEAIHLKEIQLYIHQYMNTLTLASISKTVLAIDLTEISLESVDELGKYRPLLSIQQEPTYILAPTRLGKPVSMSGGIHLKWQLRKDVSMIYFNHPFTNLDQDFSCYHSVVKVSINEFRGKREISLMVEEMVVL